MSVSEAFDYTRVRYDELILAPMEYADLNDMAKWPRFEKRALAWANFPANTDELKKRWYYQQQKGYLQWIIIRNTSGEMVGRCSLTQPLTGGTIIFGIVVRPDLLGQGLGTRITRIMISYIFELMDDIDKIWLESRYDNERAHSTWMKIGFEQQGKHYRREVFGRYDQYMGYVMTRERAYQLDLPDITIQRHSDQLV